MNASKFFFFFFNLHKLRSMMETPKMPAESTVPAVPSVVIDDDLVRVTRWDFPLNGTTGFHEHQLPYTIVMISDCKMIIKDEAGMLTETHIKAGESYQRPAGVRHEVLNGGDAPMSFIEIERKT